MRLPHRIGNERNGNRPVREELIVEVPQVERIAERGLELAAQLMDRVGSDQVHQGGPRVHAVPGDFVCRSR